MKLRSEKDHIRDYEEQGEKADPVQVHHGMTPKRSPEQELFRAARQNSDKIAKWGLHFWEQEQFLVLTLRVQVLGHQFQVPRFKLQVIRTKAKKRLSVLESGKD